MTDAAKEYWETMIAGQMARQSLKSSEGQALREAARAARNEYTNASTEAFRAATGSAAPDAPPIEWEFPKGEGQTLTKEAYDALPKAEATPTVETEKVKMPGWWRPSGTEVVTSKASYERPVQTYGPQYKEPEQGTSQASPEELRLRTARTEYEKLSDKEKALALRGTTLSAPFAFGGSWLMEKAGLKPEVSTTDVVALKVYEVKERKTKDYTNVDLSSLSIMGRKLPVIKLKGTADPITSLEFAQLPLMVESGFAIPALTAASPFATALMAKPAVQLGMFGVQSAWAASVGLGIGTDIKEGRPAAGLGKALEFGGILGGYKIGEGIYKSTTTPLLDVKPVVKGRIGAEARQEAGKGILTKELVQTEYGTGYKTREKITVRTTDEFQAKYMRMRMEAPFKNPGKLKEFTGTLNEFNENLGPFYKRTIIDYGNVRSSPGTGIIYDPIKTGIINQQVAGVMDQSKLAVRIATKSKAWGIYAGPLKIKTGPTPFDTKTVGKAPYADTIIIGKNVGIETPRHEYIHMATGYTDTYEIDDNIGFDKLVFGKGQDVRALPRPLDNRPVMNVESRIKQQVVEFDFQGIYPEPPKEFKASDFITNIGKPSGKTTMKPFTFTAQAPQTATIKNVAGAKGVELAYKVGTTTFKPKITNLGYPETKTAFYPITRVSKTEQGPPNPWAPATTEWTLTNNKAFVEDDLYIRPEISAQFSSDKLFSESTLGIRPRQMTGTKSGLEFKTNSITKIAQEERQGSANMLGLGNVQGLKFDQLQKIEQKQKVTLKPPSPPTVTEYSFGFSPGGFGLGNIGGGRSSSSRISPEFKRPYRYTPTIIGLASGRTIRREPLIGPAEAVGIRYPLEPKKRFGSLFSFAGFSKGGMRGFKTSKIGKALGI